MDANPPTHSILVTDNRSHPDMDDYENVLTMLPQAAPKNVAQVILSSAQRVHEDAGAISNFIIDFQKKEVGEQILEELTQLWKAKPHKTEGISFVCELVLEEDPEATRLASIFQ